MKELTLQRFLAPHQPDRVRQLFRLWSLVYDRPFFQLGYFGHVHRAMMKELPSNRPEAILDIGCGTGLLLEKLARRWPSTRLVGVDLSGGMLAKARENLAHHPHVELVQGSVYDLPFSDGTFDLVVNTISSHWYLHLGSALDELSRVSRPGGSFIMASLHNGPLSLVPGPWREELALWSSNFRSVKTQLRTLTDAGFTPRRTRHLFPGNTALISAVAG